MARALLLALTCAAAASAARYGDYSGVKMPAYGGGGGGDYDAPREPAAVMPSDDYRGHSPDAPASLDYKYEEEPRMKTEKPSKDPEEPEVWRKPGRKQRGLMRPLDSVSSDVGNKYDREEEDVPKFRSSHRFPKHRSRLKNDAPARDEESPPRRPIKYSRDRKDDVSDIDRKDYFHVDKDDKEDFPEDKSKEFDEDVKFVNEATTVRRVNRRKPRDRHIKRTGDDLAYDADLGPERRIKEDSDMEGPRRTRPAGGGGRGRDRYRQMLEDDDEDPNKVQPLNKFKQKTYEDYDDYYDMKRVNNIKSKLPLLLRRTSERAHPPTATSFLDMLRSNRRMYPPESSPLDEPAFYHDQPRTTECTTATITTKIKTTKTTTAKTTQKTTKTTTTTATTSKTSTTTIDPAALSLAEKSRLSIMKKDQRKEGQHVEPQSKKPPVLLQVTSNVPTVVMVEPPSSMGPYMRAHDLVEDSPQRLDKVKKLMRHKLVSDAKNIRELTDNWDDMVCDYIDVSLIDGCVALRSSLPLIIVLSLLARMFLIYV